MSRFLIFDTSAAVDSKGNTIDQAVFSDAPNVKRSVPVRLYGAPDGDIRYLSLEFLLEAAAGVGEVIPLLWAMEFQSDKPAIVIPTLRTDLNVTPTQPWGAEQTQETGGSGAVAHYDVTRTMSCNTNIAALAVCKVVTLMVHALFARVKINVASAPTNAHRLRIFAIMGGQVEESAAEASQVPWIGSV
jgi:hypothetical protein